MNTDLSKIDFKFNEAKYDEIFKHLTECSAHFLPPLSSYVNIEEYVEKLIKFSLRLEAWSSEILVGLAAIYLNDTSHKNAFITNISVASDFQGKGVATVLIKLAILKAQEKGFKKILLSVGSRNFSAMNLYQRFGFKITSIKDNFIDMEKKL